MRKRIVVVLLLLVSSLAAGQAVKTAYQKAPEPISEILNTRPTPTVAVSPAMDRIILVDRLRQPPIGDLARPMLRLAGLRIDPAANTAHRQARADGFTLVNVADGKQTKVSVPQNAWLSAPYWAADGKQFAFTNRTDNGVELWIGDTTGRTRKLSGIAVNGVLPRAVQWMPDSRTLLVRTVPAGRGKLPEAAKVPSGPTVQESSSKPAPVRTFQDLLANAHDEALFDYYATSQLALIDAASGKVTPVGKPAIFDEAEPSPDGKHLLVARVRKPYSYLMPVQMFGVTAEVWDRTGKVEYKIADAPSQEGVPIEGVITGPRNWVWRGDTDATLIWFEALDEGNPKKKVPHRDRLLALAAPFTGQPTEFLKTEHRAVEFHFGDKGLAFVTEYDRDKRWVRTFLLNLDTKAEPKQVWSRSVNDRYGDPGDAVLRTLPNGRRVMWQDGDSLFLIGNGASVKGDRPFVDRFNLATLKSERIFQSGETVFEQPITLLAADGSQVLTSYESPTEPTNYFVRNGEKKLALSNIPDPAPQLRGIKKQLVTYKRNDGVQLSFTLYLPAGYKEGQRLPTLVWAYPLEYTDASTAGQVSGSQYRFTMPTGISHLFALTQGYAVLDGATMPVVGDPETMNNTFIEQIVASAQAAIDKAVEMGVTDRDRVAVGGHSYGAFMTAHLLANSDLFRTGIARSGAYNRTLTPFGFQSERRTLWEAPETYMKLSPFMAANKINEPILLIHGEADNNSGTFPIQSERMFQAIKGNGGTIRYVTLPLEEHGYTGRESVEHTLWEMITWLDKWVKNPPAKK